MKQTGNKSKLGEHEQGHSQERNSKRPQMVNNEMLKLGIGEMRNKK